MVQWEIVYEHSFESTSVTKEPLVETAHSGGIPHVAQRIGVVNEYLPNICG